MRFSVGRGVYFDQIHVSRHHPRDGSRGLTSRILVKSPPVEGLAIKLLDVAAAIGCREKSTQFVKVSLSQLLRHGKDSRVGIQLDSHFLRQLFRDVPTGIYRRPRVSHRRHFLRDAWLRRSGCHFRSGRRGRLSHRLRMARTASRKNQRRQRNRNNGGIQASHTSSAVTSQPRRSDNIFAAFPVDVIMLRHFVNLSRLPVC
jgi:hypothetical protein